MQVSRCSSWGLCTCTAAFAQTGIMLKWWAGSAPQSGRPAAPCTHRQNVAAEGGLAQAAARAVAPIVAAKLSAGQAGQVAGQGHSRGLHQAPGGKGQRRIVATGQQRAHIGRLLQAARVGGAIVVGLQRGAGKKGAPAWLGARPSAGAGCARRRLLAPRAACCPRASVPAHPASCGRQGRGLRRAPWGWGGAPAGAPWLLA